MYANCIIIGRLGTDPEVKQTLNGKAYCQLSVAVDDRTDKNQTSWFRVTYWEKTAMHIAQYLKKGSKVYCEARPYESENDGRRFWNFAGNICVFLDSAKDTQNTQPVDDNCPF